MTSDTLGYPIRLDVQRSDSQSRLTNFPLGIGTIIRVILLIPHLIILYFLQIVAQILYFIATFAILFTGSYPRGMFNFYVGYLRWNANVYGYFLHLYDAYPPFSMEQQPYALTLSVDYPERLSRFLNFPLFIGAFIKTVLSIPHIIILAFLIFAAVVVVFIVLFAVLFTGAFPAGMHSFVVGVYRWLTRVNAYIYGLTDAYPPFSTR